MEAPAAGLAPSLTLSPEEGEVRFGEPLSKHTTLRIGGPAEIFCEVKSESGLARLLAFARDKGLPFRLLGKGSNILVTDDPIPGVLALLSGNFLKVAIDGERILCGGGASLGGVCAAAARAGLSGLEPISGIPSSMGGAVRINAGAYGGEIFDVLESVRLVARDGSIREARASEIRHGYRSTELMETGEIVASLVLRLRPEPREVIEEKTRVVTEKRRGALPAEPNAGSVFKNPPGDYAGRLIEACSLKGKREGGAEISPRHANVIVNKGGGKATDVLALMRLMRDAVREKFGITLIPEIDFLGLSWE